MHILQILLILTFCSSAFGQNTPIFFYKDEFTKNKGEFIDKNQKNLKKQERASKESDTRYKMQLEQEQQEFEKDLDSTFRFLNETGFYQIGHLGQYNIDTLNSYLYNQATVDILQSFHFKILRVQTQK